MCKQSTNCKPLFHWAGGKGRIINQLTPHVPPTFGDYFEPFLGSGRMLFTLLPKQNIYINDLNSDLINLYTQIKNSPNEFVSEFQQIIPNDSKKHFIQELLTFNKAKTFDLQRAVKFLFLMRTSYGGVYRVNNLGFLNSSYGKKHKFPSSSDILDLSTYLNSCSSCLIMNNDFETILTNAKKNDFIYMDPPYPDNKVNYTTTPFKDADHKRVKNILDDLTQKKAKVMITYKANDFIKGLFSNYKIIPLSPSISLNSKSQNRNNTDFEEILILNY